MKVKRAHKIVEVTDDEITRIIKAACEANGLIVEEGPGYWPAVKELFDFEEDKDD